MTFFIMFLKEIFLRSILPYTKQTVSSLSHLLFSLDPDDLKTIAHLVAAYSQIDAKKCEQYPSGVIFDVTKTQRICRRNEL